MISLKGEKSSKSAKKGLVSACKVRNGCYIMIPVAPGDGADAWNSDLADEEKNKKSSNCRLKKQKSMIY